MVGISKTLSGYYKEVLHPFSRHTPPSSLKFSRVVYYTRKWVCKHAVQLHQSIKNEKHIKLSTYTLNRKNPMFQLNLFVLSQTNKNISMYFVCY